MSIEKTIKIMVIAFGQDVLKSAIILATFGNRCKYLDGDEIIDSY